MATNMKDQVRDRMWEKKKEERKRMELESITTSRDGGNKVRSEKIRNKTRRWRRSRRQMKQNKEIKINL